MLQPTLSEFSGSAPGNNNKRISTIVQNQHKCTCTPVILSFSVVIMIYNIQHGGSKQILELNVHSGY